MTPRRTVSDAERRARLGVRHGLGASVSGVVAAARAVVCLHATEPTTVYLSAWARSRASRAEVDAVLYAERSLVKQLAMRRTLFAVPVDLLPAVRGSAAARVAAQQRALLARGVVAGGLSEDGSGWVDAACVEVLGQLRHMPASTSQLRASLPRLAARLPRPESRAAPPAPVAARVLTVLAATGEVVRGANDGAWAVSRPVWTRVEEWLDQPAPPLAEADGYAELVRRWLWAYGPGTETDLVWWLGATKTSVRRALTEISAVPVQLQDGEPAWLHPDDFDEVAEPDPWAALLPALDPTTMGWRQRAFHLDRSVRLAVYDRAGNGLPSAWWCGRIVGGWQQQNDGSVVLTNTAGLSRPAMRALKQEADLLTEWLDGHPIRTSFQRPLEGPTPNNPS